MNFKKKLRHCCKGSLLTMLKETLKGDAMRNSSEDENTIKNQVIMVLWTYFLP